MFDLFSVHLVAQVLSIGAEDRSSAPLCVLLSTGCDGSQGDGAMEGRVGLVVVVV